uniref:Uncharacterized protein n=1 Tax=Arundo donax TaxID=35708 RepID=A0A0A9HRU3_ARUDO
MVLTIYRKIYRKIPTNQNCGLFSPHMIQISSIYQEQEQKSNAIEHDRYTVRTLK